MDVSWGGGGGGTFDTVLFAIGRSSSAAAALSPELAEAAAVGGGGGGDGKVCVDDQGLVVVGDEPLPGLCESRAEEKKRETTLLCSAVNETHGHLKFR